MERREKLYEGKAKIVYVTDNPDYIIQYFKDDATAFNAKKRGTIAQKGVVNNHISTKVFQYLEACGIPTHFEKILSEREMLVKRVEIIPLEVIIRNVVAGSLSRLLNLEEGMPLSRSVLEFCYKDDALDDPLINEYHILALNFASAEDIQTIKDYAFRINDLMKEFFGSINLNLIDFKLEFGRWKDKIILADEISPDTCRLWEKGTGEKMDKDRFRRDLGNIEETYQEVLNRVMKQ